MEIVILISYLLLEKGRVGQAFTLKVIKKSPRSILMFGRLMNIKH